ncbi:MAG: YitT family protein [Bacilli bacterium]|nr:YitT family protein [Bacilli bacterium]
MKYNKKIVSRYLYFFLGLFSFSVSFTFFLSPNNLVFGGVSGLSLVFKELFGINTSLFVLLCSIGVLIISFPLLGKEKTYGSILGSLLLPLFLELTELISYYIAFETNDLLLSSIFGGVLGGIGFGLVYKAGFTTGGTDIIKQILNKYLKISLGKAMFIVESIIVVSGIFVFGITKALYALVVLFIMTEITDRVILGVSRSKAFYIVTSETDKVKKYIINSLGHSVTIFDAIGGFSKENEKVLFCVIPTREYYILKEGINNIDKDAFFVVCDAYEVHGGE